MSTLIFNPSACVRSVTKFSECTKCVEICPVGTLHIADNNLPAFTPSACVDCGGCLGVCPSEAFKLKGFDPTEFFFSFATSDEALISCRLNVPCIAALSSEHLIALALIKEDPMVLDIGHCQSCPYKEPLYVQILKSVEEANYLLEACESGKVIRVEEVAVEEEDVAEDIDPNDRRAFLERLSLKGVVQSKREFEDAVASVSDETKTHHLDLVDVAKIRQKSLPDKRKILFTALKRAPKPSIFHTIAEEDISFASQKYIDMESCTNCQMCYRICPTGALSSNPKNSKIYFDTMMCIKCRACHDTCEPDSLKLQPTFELKEFFEPTQRLLATFKLVRCRECGVHFTSLHGEQTCPRCMVEEEEALDLWGLEEQEDGTVVFKTLQEDKG
ncbi:MAG: 4Fe-4S ferredoxin [Hydrogenimonas sp.]|nr:MAG: 4Fe-4S ferredoxin [Hydrogenimonas sp.]